MAGRYNYYDLDTYITNSIYEPYRSGQTFTTFVSYTLTSVRVFANRRGSPGDVTVSLYATDVDGKPTGSALSTGTIAEGDLTDSVDDTGCAWVTATMASYVLVASTKYAIVLSIAAGDVSNKARFMYDVDGDPIYSGGTFLTTTDSGVTWTTFSNTVGLFEIHGSPDPSAPTVTTQAVTDIEATTATGNGNITNLGSFPVTQHGVCWNTTGTPTTADDKTEEGAAGVGAFTSSITGLTSGTKYFVRAYATNSYGTSYGAEVNFISGVTGLKGCIWQETTKTHFIDENQAEQSFEGALVAAGSNPKGTIWAELTKFHYIDEEGDERSKEGTATGDTGPKGTIFIEGANFHGIDAEGDERYIGGD